MSKTEHIGYLSTSSFSNEQNIDPKRRRLAENQPSTKHCSDLRSTEVSRVPCLT
jgi:hypothetical protein